MPELNTNNYFDKIVCINLDRREDRWKQVIQEFRKNNITNFERFPAIDGNSIPNKSDWMTGARIACCLSHAAVLQKMLDNNWKRILILEDDASFIERYELRFRKIVPFIPQDFDILYFCGNDPEVTTRVNSYIFRLEHCLSTGAYAITSNFAKIMLDKINQLSDAVDLIYKENTPGRNCYIFKPYLITQRPGFSDIENKFTDYSAYLKFKGKSDEHKEKKKKNRLIQPLPRPKKPT